MDPLMPWKLSQPALEEVLVNSLAKFVERLLIERYGLEEKKAS